MRPLLAVAIALATSALMIGGTAAEERKLAFERLGDDWVASPIDAGSNGIALLDRHSGQHPVVLMAEGRTPGSFGVTYFPWRDWTGFTTLSFDMYFPPTMPVTADAQVYLKDRHYYWYQAFPLHVAGGQRTPIKPGEWMSFSLDISRASVAWEPGGHRKAWGEALYRPREFGIRVFCNQPWEGSVLLDNVALSGSEPPLGRFDPNVAPKLSWGLDLDLNATEVPVYEKFELTFDPGRAYENPFDPRVVDVEGHFRAPSGREMTVPGFFYQDFERSQTAEGWEKLIPVGAPSWKVRFSPTEEGNWKFYVSVRDALGELRSEEHRCVATAPLDSRGLVGVSERDPMYFEFENGELFTPSGVNMRDGGDDAERQKGTYAFDYFFPRFHEEGLNFVRTWMAAWWAGIEWSPDYHSRFDGVGRYSMYNAWRLDYMFDIADANDLFIELTLNSHGQLRRDKYDAEWRYNPYAARNGGYVASPSMLFTNEQAREDFKRRYRYIVARWGYSQHLMSYDLWNEIDLSEGSNAREIAAWHKEMADYLRSIDPWGHLITTHVCLYGGFGDALWNLPEIEYIQADAYWQPWSRKLNEFFDGEAGHREKPMLFIEYGPQTADVVNHELSTGTPYPRSIWQREFRVVGWTGMMMPMACPPVWWYHEEWDRLKLYELQHAMMRFSAGLDPRGLEMRKVSARTSDPRNLFAQAKSGVGITEFYVYDWPNMIYEAPDLVPDTARVRGAWLSLSGVPEGSYRLQWWDPFRGEPTGEQELEVSGPQVRIELPEFAQDLAAKLIATGEQWLR